MSTPWRKHDAHHGERGVTMIFVALAMVTIIAMVVLSIDVVILYLEKEEAQHSADAAALAAARVLSLSGVTGDPANIQGGLPVRELLKFARFLQFMRSRFARLIARKQRHAGYQIVILRVKNMSRTLTAKEERITALVIQGMNNDEISKIIGTTENVIKNYLRIIFDKTGTSTRLELALWYIDKRIQDCQYGVA